MTSAMLSETFRGKDVFAEIGVSTSLDRSFFSGFANLAFNGLSRVPLNF